MTKRVAKSSECSSRICSAIPIVPFIGNGSARKRPVFAGDIVDGLRRLANQPISHGKVYNFSGAESISMIDFARLALAHHGSRRRFVFVPVSWCLAHCLRLEMGLASARADEERHLSASFRMPISILPKQSATSATGRWAFAKVFGVAFPSSPLA